MNNLKLFIPGPVSVRQDVLEQLSNEQISHRGKDIEVLQEKIVNNLKIIFNTKNQILLSTSSGSGLMEGAVRSTTAKKAAFFSVGAFGKKWYRMAIDNNVPADLYEANEGDAITPEMVEKVLQTKNYDVICITQNETSTGIQNPIEEISKVVQKYDDIIFCIDMVSSAGGVKLDLDEMGVDIAITSSQKCLGLPAGFSACTISQKAIEKFDKVEKRGSYFDFKKLLKFAQKNQYPSTPSIPHMFALEYQLDYIINKEKFDNRVKRHSQMANIVRNWAKKYFELYVNDEKYASNTVTCIKNTKNIDIKNLIDELKKKGKLMGNGYGDLKDKTFRIAHMADTRIEEIEELLNDIDEILKLK